MNLLLTQDDDIVKPYELASINNPDLLKIFIKNYDIYYFDIRDEILINVDQTQKYLYRILLNPNNNYLFIINNVPLTVIAEHDCFARKYVNENGVWHISNTWDQSSQYNLPVEGQGNIYGKWSCRNIISIINRCDSCYDFYFKTNFENICGTCRDWLVSGRKLSKRIKKVIGKKNYYCPLLMMMK